MMKLNYALISRVLIALLFVVAGVQKAMNFSNPMGPVSFVGSLGIPMPMLVTILVIIIEVPVALAYAYGYRVCITGGILAAFTFLTIVLVHKNVLGADMTAALKNLAIIGGILATTGTCSCGRCEALNPKK